MSHIPLPSHSGTGSFNALPVDTQGPYPDATTYEEQYHNQHHHNQSQCHQQGYHDAPEATTGYQTNNDREESYYGGYHDPRFSASTAYDGAVYGGYDNQHRVSGVSAYEEYGQGPYGGGHDAERLSATTAYDASAYRSHRVSKQGSSVTHTRAPSYEPPVSEGYYPRSVFDHGGGGDGNRGIQHAVQQQYRPNYRPSALQWPFLSVLFVVLLSLIGLMAYAVHVLPVERDDMIPAQIRGGLKMVRRQEGTPTTPAEASSSVVVPPSSIETTVATMPVSEFNTAPGQTVVITSSTPPPADVTGTAAPSDFNNIGSQSVTTPIISSSQNDDDAISTRTASDFNDVGTQSVTTSESLPVVGTMAPDDFGSIGTVTITSATMIPSMTTDAFGSIGTVTVTSAVVFVTSTPVVGVSTISTPRVVSLTDSEGRVTGTSTSFPTPTFVTGRVTTLTDAAGRATATRTSTPPVISTPVTSVLTDSLGRPTATIVTSALAAPSTSVLTDSNGVPTATVTSYPQYPTEPIFGDGGGDDKQGVGVYVITYGEYFAGMFLPTLLAILISIPVRVIDMNAKLLQPWHELTHHDGATGRESLCLQTSGWQSLLTSIRSLFGGQALVFLTTTLAASATLLVPLSAEAVSFSLRGTCREGGYSGRNCAFVLSVFDAPAKAALALLAFMAATVLFILAFLLRGWNSGVPTNPWSICGVASLSQNPDVRRLFARLPSSGSGEGKGRKPTELLRDVLKNRRFKLGYFRGASGGTEYGVVLHEGFPDGHSLRCGSGDSLQAEKMAVQEGGHGHGHVETSRHLPFLMLGYPGRFLFLFVLCGLLGVILYYNNTGGDTPFERFMDSESFGVRFSFTAVGVVITLFWSSFFSSIAILSPYHLLSLRPQQAQHSILLSPPTNAFSGLTSALRRRHPYLALVALVAILSELLTLFLANVPFHVTQTYAVSRVCNWTSVAILCVMILVVLASFAVRWPHMPVDPSTVAGAMFYVCDSWMMADRGPGGGAGGGLEGLGTLGRRERDARVVALGLRYEFGEMLGVSGVRRVGVDCEDTLGGAGVGAGAGGWI